MGEFHVRLLTSQTWVGCHGNYEVDVKLLGCQFYIYFRCAGKNYLSCGLWSHLSG